MEYLRNKQSGKSFTNTTIVITGFAGFLGYYFVQFFLTQNIKRLILLDNFILRKPSWLAAIESDSRVTILTFDISKDDYAGNPIFAEADYVVHMASIASPMFYRRYPLETIESNILGLRILLEYYKTSTKLKGLLFFSSSEIYGDPDPACVPTPEDYYGNVCCTGPRSCYDESKRIGETLCYCYAQVHGMPIGVARPFNNYGPGMDITDKRLPADFAKAIIANEDIVILSDGRPKRTFCYITDAIDGYLRMLTRGKYDYFNIGIDAPEISVRDMAGIYRDVATTIFGYSKTIQYQTSEDVDYLTNNPNRRCPDISKARNILGYDPQIAPEEGVRRYLQFLKEERGT
jgi:UDP-glucuronate decarboxylase